MKILILLICSFACFVPCVYSVKSCISCVNCPEIFTPGAPDSAGNDCPSGRETCMKQTIKYPGGVMISKGCVQASNCKEISLNLAGIGFWLSCCTNLDNCNASNILTINTTLLSFVLLLTFIEIYN